MNIKEYKMDKNIIIEYVYFLNYIGFDNHIINLLEFFDNYKSDIKYILEISNLYPQYNKIIQKKLNKYIFNKKELDELENIYQISNYDLYFIIKDKEDKIKDVKLSIILENINNLNKFDYDNIYGLKYKYKEIKEFPKEINNLTNLQTLYLSYNQISIIPDTLWSVPAEKGFSLFLPKEISNLTNLQTLDLNNNQISIIPKK